MLFTRERVCVFYKGRGKKNVYVIYFYVNYLFIYLLHAQEAAANTAEQPSFFNALIYIQ